jgi:hypothetical protein
VVGRNADWATAWQPSPTGQPTCGSAVARRRQGVAEDLEGVTGKVPGKEERAGAHGNGGSTVRQCKQRRATTFISGEGAPVVASGCDEVLQLERGERVRDLQEISGIGSKGRSSPGGGGRRRCSAEIHEGEGAAGGRRRRSGCGEQWGGSGAREEGSERSGDGGNEWARSSALQRGKEKRGGPSAEVPRGVGRCRGA